MLNRRHLRIKGLQTIYAYHQAEVRDLRAFEKNLLSDIQKVQEYYIYLLLLIVELASFEEEDAKERKTKHLPSKEDMDSKALLSDNLFIKLLKDHEQFNQMVKKYKLNWAGETVLLREIYNKLKSIQEYKDQADLKEKNYKSDQDFILFIYKNVIFQFPLLEQHLEEKNINWSVDENIVESMVLKTIKNFKDTDISENKLVPLTANWEDDSHFILELFQKTVLNDKQYGEYIADKTKNWDVERIALIDTILMKMAITEMIHFSSIPVKVSMNEYIDISKEFSTPKSKIFINGILDKILVDLKKNDLINKTGRGLIE
jgi:transcription antitermination protein NusB